MHHNNPKIKQKCEPPRSILCRFSACLIKKTIFRLGFARQKEKKKFLFYCHSYLFNNNPKSTINTPLDKLTPFYFPPSASPVRISPISYLRNEIRYKITFDVTNGFKIKVIPFLFQLSFRERENWTNLIKPACIFDFHIILKDQRNKIVK